VAIFTIFCFSGGTGGTDSSGSDYTPLDAGVAQEDEGVGQSVAGVLVCAGIFLGLLVILLLCLGKGKSQKYRICSSFFLYFKRVKKFVG
jgi:hypothetical protein